MTYASYRISAGSGRRRLVGFCVGILVPLATVIALDQGLKLNLVGRIIDIAVVPVTPTNEPQPKPQQAIPNPGAYDPGAIDIPEPQIPTGDTASGPTVTATVGAATQARFRTSNSIPLYPESAKRNCEQGTVALDLSIGADGRVIDASVATSSGYPSLDDAALRAARGWRFTPAQQAGKAVESSITQRVKFDLRNEIGVSMTAAQVRECLRN